MTGKKIFILDDDRDILDSMRMVLEFKGYTIHTSASVENLKHISEKDPDLLLIDLWMSGVDGSDICRQLKNNTQTRHIPVVIISANANIKELSLNCKADGYLSKPFEIDELLSTVQRYTSNT
ncbi:response regulator [Agriterribacter sp.]|uniref:response regulator n=1 Tax=Agriterribacter sp. TaxID=2821509 RepID=UPI002C8DF9C9|nr:response regulator [Agriterribacter sp.]HRP57100.1 response regulator [Agriterribacter sp.]